jgi:tellurite resistance protein
MSSILKDTLTESKFNMWRACIAIIHLDGKITPEEKEWAEEKIKLIPFNADQENILIGDLQGGVELSSVILKVEDKKDKAFLVHMVRVIGFIDGDFSSSEKRACEKLEQAILKNIDLAPLEQEIKEMEKESYHKSNVYQQTNKKSKFEHMYLTMKKYMNPGDYKFPNKE